MLKAVDDCAIVMLKAVDGQDCAIVKLKAVDGQRVGLCYRQAEGC